MKWYIIFIWILLLSSSVNAAVPEMALVSVYFNNSGTGTVEGVKHIYLDRDFPILYANARTDNAVTQFKILPNGTLVMLKTRTSTSTPGSFNGIEATAFDWTNRLYYTAGYNADAFSNFNVTIVNEQLMNGTAAWSATSGNNGSLDGIWGIDYYDSGVTKMIITASDIDDVVTTWNVSNPWVQPIGLNASTRSANPCSFDQAREIQYIGNGLFLVAATTDDTISIINVSSTGVITCVTNRTLAAGAGSIDGLSSFYYENTTGLVYIPATVDDYLSIYNVSTKTNIVSVGSVTNAALDALTFVTVTNISTDKWAFVGLFSTLTANFRIGIVNVTNPASPTYYGSFNTSTNANCKFNQTAKMVVKDNYLIASSFGEGCLYTIRLYNVSYGSTPLINYTAPTLEDGNVSSTLVDERIVNITFNTTEPMNSFNITFNDKTFNIWNKSLIWWTFNNVTSIGSSGFRVTDISPRGLYDLDSYRETFIENGYIRFTGGTNSSVAQTFKTVDLNDTSQLSVSFWFYSSKNRTTGEGSGYFFGDASQSQTVGYLQIQQVGGTTFHQLGIEYANTTATFGTSIACSQNPADRAWTHVVMQIDYANDVFQCYLNGELDRNVSIPNAVQPVTPRTLYLGDYANPYTRQNISASFDDFIVIKGLLSTDEVRHLYRMKFDKTAPNSYIYQYNITNISYGITNYSITVNDSLTQRNLSRTFTITAPSGASCTYSGTGNWNIDCVDSCNLNTPTTIVNGNITFSGSGTVIISNVINGWKKAEWSNTCKVNVNTGGELRAN